MFAASFLVVFGSLVTNSLAGSLADIKHVVLFMQENRAFDHVGNTIVWGNSPSDNSSILGPCLEFAVLQIQMFKSIQTAKLLFSSKHPIFLAQCVKAYHTGW
jgi:phospholipase C